MKKTIKLTISGRGIQSYAYYISPQTVLSLESKEYAEDGTSAWEFVQENADEELNVSYGLCLDDSELQVTITDGEIERPVDYQDLDEGDPVDPDMICYRGFENVIYAEKPDPKENQSVVLEFSTYQIGTMETYIEVDEDFKLSDLTFITQNIDRAGWLGEVTYFAGMITIDDAEQDIVAITYKGKTFDLPGSLSFSTAGMELQLHKRNENGVLECDIFSDLFN